MTVRLESVGQESGRQRSAEAAVITLAVLAVIGAIWIAREVLVPFALALVAATLLRRVVSRLERWRVPAPAAAAIVVLTTLAVVGGIGAALEGPVRSMAADLPKSVTTARMKLDSMTARLREFSSSGAKNVPPGSTPAPATPATRTSTTPKTTAAQSAGPAQAPSETGNGGASAALRSAFGMTTSLLTEIVEEVLLVFFLLAAGKGWMAKLGRITRSSSGPRLWPSIAGEMHDVVARYVFVTLVINIGQATVIGLALWAIGVPTPLLWGVLTFVAEFVPYLGGIVMIALLAAAGLSTGNSTLHALMGPGIYLVVTTLQNNLVSPMAYGRGLRLNPTMILLSVMFWWMVWGVAGAFLAVPILASLRVLGSRIPTLEPLAVMLEE